MAEVDAIPEWRANLVPTGYTWSLQRDVDFVDMATGKAFFKVLAGAKLETIYVTTVGGVHYAMTWFSVQRDKGHGFRYEDLEAATAPSSEPTTHIEVAMTDDKTSADERTLFEKVLAMLAGGKDGVEAGLTTTEFWFAAVTLVVDLFGPSVGVLHGLTPDDQVKAAVAIALGYGALRSWRKRGGPAKFLAELGKILAELRGQAVPSTPPAATP